MKKNLSIFMTAGSWLQRALALFLCVAALEAVQAAPQDTKRTITGTVVDQNNLPVVGATVMISNSANGTATDSNGQFTLSGVTDNDELQISFLGYKTVTMQVGTRTAIAATLEEDSGYLDEVVVVGYGTTTRRHIISAVSTVKSEAIENRPVANIQQALQGAAANLIIQTKNFNPTDNQMNISIRGVNTMGNNTPLVVIDGDQVQLSQQSLEKAHENERQAMERYNEGEISIVEVIEAQTYRQNAEINHVQAKASAQGQ